jgi:hypothetical protein
MTAPTDFVYNVLVIQRAPSAGDDYLWVNRHEITSEAGLLGDAAAVNAVATAFANYHRNVLLQGFGVDRVVISTYGPDLPWPPGFASVPGPWTGQRSPAGSEPLPLECALFVRRNVLRGRDGKFFLRGVLTAAQVDRFGNVDGDFRNYVNQQGTTLLNALQSANVRMVMASGPIAAVQTRDVSSLTAVNFRTLQFRTRRKSAIVRYQVDSLLDNLTGPEAQVLRRLLARYGWTDLPPLLPPPQ